MTSIRYEQERIKFEKEALREYDRELWYSIEKCKKMKEDEFYSSIIDRLKERREQAQEWNNNLMAQEAAVLRMIEWENRAKILDKLAASSAIPEDGREVAEEQLRSLKEKAYTAQALVDLRM